MPPSYHLPLPSALNMTPPHFSDLLSSETLEIIAESGKKRFTVHSGIFATQSETAEKKIDLSDWDGDTVGRFFQFLYIGDYVFPKTISDDTKTEDGTGDDEEEGRRDGVNTPDTVQSVAAREGWEFRNTDVNVLLIHAKVYTLAQYRNIEDLRVMALERLKAALEEIDGLTSRSVSDAVNVIELLGYVYSHTDDYSWQPIRDLVLQFSAGNVEHFVDREEMALLLSEEGSLAVELMEKVAGRLCNVGIPYGMAGKSYGMEGELRNWKDRAAASDEKVRELEAAHAEAIQQLEASNAEKIRQTEAASAAKVQELGAKITRFKAAFSEKVSNYDKAKKRYPWIEMDSWRELIFSKYGFCVFLFICSMGLIPKIVTTVFVLTLAILLIGES